jgi:hypothetical protein
MIQRNQLLWIRLAIAAHRTELDKAESLAMEPAAILLKEDRAAAGELDKYRDEQERQRAKHDQHCGGYGVEDALAGSGIKGRGRLADGIHPDQSKH